MITSNFKVRTDPQSKAYSINFARLNCANYVHEDYNKDKCKVKPEFGYQPDCDGCAYFERKK